MTAECRYCGEEITDDGQGAWVYARGQRDAYALAATFGDFEAQS